MASEFLSPNGENRTPDPVSQVLNGVFKGGGAKGILYGGALESVAEGGFWFRAVAGSSAGAITASLIAAGLSPGEIVKEVPKGLLGVKTVYLADLVGSPIFRTAGLQAWLEEIFRSRTGRSGAEKMPVTFSELYGASGIELFVVTVDVADRQPRVFSSVTTPDLSVASAVVASSAIPVVFRPGRLEVQSSMEKNEVHRLMDGGVWANYPAFIFRDPSFRAFHNLQPISSDSLTIGFTLDSTNFDESKPAIRFRTGMLGASRDKGGFLPWLFSNPFMRFYFMTIVPIITALQFWYTINAAGLIFLKDYATRDGVPDFLTRSAGFVDGFFSNFWPGYTSIILALFIAATVAAFLGGTLMDSGVPAMRTLLSVGTDVPYWVGAHSDDHVVRLNVPAWLTTARFKLSEMQISEAVALGREQAAPQLKVIFASRSAGPPETETS